MLTAKDLCKRYHISRPTLGAWVTKQIVPPPIRFGRVLRWREEDLAAAEQPSKPQATGATNA